MGFHVYIYTEGAHRIVPDLVIVPVGRMSPGAHIIVPALTHIINPNRYWGGGTLRIAQGGLIKTLAEQVGKLLKIHRGFWEAKPHKSVS